jgi:hypothetical protein
MENQMTILLLQILKNQKDILEALLHRSPGDDISKRIKETNNIILEVSDD